MMHNSGSDQRKHFAVQNTVLATFILRLPHSKVCYTGQVPLSHQRHHDPILSVVSWPDRATNLLWDSDPKTSQKKWPELYSQSGIKYPLYAISKPLIVWWDFQDLLKVTSYVWCKMKQKAPQMFPPIILAAELLARACILYPLILSNKGWKTIVKLWSHPCLVTLMSGRTDTRTKGISLFCKALNKPFSLRRDSPLIPISCETGREHLSICLTVCLCSAASTVKFAGNSGHYHSKDMSVCL